MAENIDNFNAVTGLVFAQLYSVFPVRQDLNEKIIADAMGVEAFEVEGFSGGEEPIYNFGEIAPGLKFRKLVLAVTCWLRDEGFVRAEGQRADLNMVLTAKALTALNATPRALEGTLGSKLTTAAKHAGTEAGRSAIAETVGQVIGAAVKSMSN